MQDLADEELVSRYRREGGAPAPREILDELFRRYHSRVAAWCYRFTGDPYSAADLAQEIFLKALKHIDSFRGQSEFSTWMYSITRNHCFNELKSRSTRPREDGGHPLEHIADNGGVNAEDTLIRDSSAESVRALLADTLDETELKVFTLHYADDVTLDAITRILALTNASGAKAYIVSARRKLKSAVQRWKAKQERGAH